MVRIQSEIKTGISATLMWSFGLGLWSCGGVNVGVYALLYVDSDTQLQIQQS